jgi:hypothetical protein
VRYTEDGLPETDNNPIENAIRPVVPIAIGSRKNYMLCGSHEAAQRSAMLYSLLGTCKLHGINPAAWLEDMQRRIGGLPPHRWRPARRSVEAGN